VARRAAFPATIRAVKKTSYPTPQDAEAAFYEALESGDLEAMMDVWADDEEIVCVHPGGPRIAGYEQVRESWSRILASGQRLKVQLADQVYVQGMMVSLHSVHEIITVGDDAARQHPVVTTNVYLRTSSGWRMVAHHSSPAPQAERPAKDAPKTLH
jgi:ketosteroid isomerase-like protein